MQQSSSDDLSTPNGVAHFRWQIPATLAGCAFPRSPEVLASLRQHGVRALVNLSDSPAPTEQLAQSGLQATHVPVADFTAPTIAQIEEAIEAINRFLEQVGPVAARCGAGLGRTGTLPACYLVWQGMPTSDALTQVRLSQPGSLETPGQEATIARYAQWLREGLREWLREGPQEWS